MSNNIPVKQDVETAYERIKHLVVKTPLIENDILNKLCGGRVFLKPECLQHTGSFKFRGASNALLSLTDEQRKKGVIACSSGNHAQGIAEVARRLGIEATILMPEDSPKSKLARTKRSGAKVITYDRATQDREVLIADMAKEQDLELIHPFDDARVIAGQGSIGFELIEQLGALGVSPDHLLSCAGGGGLIGGITLAVHEHFKDLSIHSCEPENFDDYAKSVAKGKRVRNPTTSGSICDAIVTPEPGKISFEICKDILSEGLAVSDDEALAAVKFAFHELKLVLEPGGAVALAAILAGKLDLKGKIAVAILSGGNVDEDMFIRAIAS